LQKLIRAAFLAKSVEDGLVTLPISSEPGSPFILTLFGPFEVRMGQQLLPPLRTRKGYQILALLALRASREVERTWLAGLLWPDSDEEKSAANLRNTLKDLRSALGEEAGRLRSPSSRTLTLDLTGTAVDVVAFDQAVAQRDPASLEQAVGLYRGPLLEGWAEEWVFEERQRREQAYLEALETLAARTQELGELGAAEGYLRRIIAVDFLRESAQQTLMEVLAARDSYTAALEVYHELRRRLHQELNAEPAPETTSLFHSLRAFARQRARSKTSPPPRTETKPAAEHHVDPADGSESFQPRIVFIHQPGAEPDEQLVRALTVRLQNEGAKVIVDQRDRSGLDWSEARQQQLRSADAAVIVLSRTSFQSELFQDELQLVETLAHGQGGKPRLSTIQVGDPGPMPDELVPAADWSPQVLWKGPKDDDRAYGELMNALQSPSPSPANLPPRGGAMPLGSPYYLERPTDSEFQNELQLREGIVLIKGARQTGKTSLLVRGIQRAKEAGFQVLFTDLQRLDPADLECDEVLLKRLGAWIARQLRLDVAPQDVWNPDLGSSVNFSDYLLDHVLPSLPAHLVWAIDEADRLLTSGLSTQIFGLFRSWYNERALEPAWSSLTLAIAYATEPHLFIKAVDQSPFNVGTRLRLDDFTLDQVRELNGRYDQPLRSRSEVERFFDLVGGQPYLTTRSLREMVAQQLNLDAVEAQIADEDGIFGEHLRRLLMVLTRDLEIVEVVRGILRSQGCPSEESFYRLRSAGVMAGSSPLDVRPRCGLYERYLRRVLL
jgi:DNA-binding SARP family transcriptional activator